MLKGPRPVHFFEGAATSAGFSFSLAGFGTALVAVLWAYEGWHVVSFVAGEMKKPKVDLPRSLFYGTAIVTADLFGGQSRLLPRLPAAEIRGSNAVAALAWGSFSAGSARIRSSF